MKKLLFFAALSLLLTNIAKAQETPVKTDPIVVKMGDTSPTFQTGIPGFYQYVSNGMKNHLPRESGKVIVNFIVEKDGSVSNVTLDGSFNKRTDKQLLKIFENSPKWAPGIINGEAVRATYKLPITINP